MSANWQILARQTANKYGIPEALMLATVDAETGGQNILGDNGNAMGYGQVWVGSWWYDTLSSIAGDYGVYVPAKDDRSGLQALITSNDELSMDLAGNVVAQLWNQSGGDWDTFTRKYVGPAIPDWDLERRRAIYNKYAGAGNNASGMETKIFSVDVPSGATNVVIGIALLAVVVGLLRGD